MIKGEETLNQKYIGSFPIRKSCFTYNYVAWKEMDIEQVTALKC